MEEVSHGAVKEKLDSREKGFVRKRSSEAHLVREQWDSNGKHGAKTLDLQEKSWADTDKKPEVRSLAIPNTVML